MNFPREITKPGQYQLILRTNSKTKAINKRDELRKRLSRLGKHKIKRVFITRPRLKGIPTYCVWVEQPLK